jgi:hypothetical protein
LPAIADGAAFWAHAGDDAAIQMATADAEYFIATCTVFTPCRFERQTPLIPEFEIHIPRRLDVPFRHSVVGSLGSPGRGRVMMVRQDVVKRHQRLCSVREGAVCDGPDRSSRLIDQKSLPTLWVVS